ncbi:Aspartyl/glutamyl-tRNA (Asn/Gln) amidotransferase subunit B [Melia azedarach]|uniref:Aspartyl/glutamyl-tRNA (Asn/Gln) amidotransferase subunit B n=1 Tax=Melia azedarach TaxID=155640 RepID=A0ACC1YQL8_MELAZ|nr:Aspartyl/glutamyl-tRNA (Asn/Gln) amidotransferase subunit B [Melia azedarach]
MGNKPVVVREEREEVFLKLVPPVDRTYLRWLMRDLNRIHRFTPKNTRPVKPPDHYIEYMHWNGWLDVNLDDPDLAHLFK